MWNRTDTHNSSIYDAITCGCAHLRESVSVFNASPQDTITGMIRKTCVLLSKANEIRASSVLTSRCDLLMEQIFHMHIFTHIYTYYAYSGLYSILPILLIISIANCRPWCCYSIFHNRTSVCLCSFYLSWGIFLEPASICTIFTLLLETFRFQKH